MLLPIWLTVLLLIYTLTNVMWLILMISNRIKGNIVCQTPSDFMDCFHINKGRAIFMFILYVLIFPFYNLLLGTVKLIDCLFHIGVKDRSE